LRSQCHGEDNGNGKSMPLLTKWQWKNGATKHWQFPIGGCNVRTPAHWHFDTIVNQVQELRRLTGEKIISKANLNRYPNLRDQGHAAAKSGGPGSEGALGDTDGAGGALDEDPHQIERVGPAKASTLPAVALDGSTTVLDEDPPADPLFLRPQIVGGRNTQSRRKVAFAARELLQLGRLPDFMGHCPEKQSIEMWPPGGRGRRRRDFHGETMLREW
jgi:hypothetical protein